MKSWNEIRKDATAFSKRWRNAHDEKSQAQSFLKEFFEVFGVDSVLQATFEHRVKFADGAQGFVDFFWPGTILVEMKSKGKDLDAAYKQAMDYVRALPDKSTLPAAVVVSDFQNFRFHDLAKDGRCTKFKLADLRRYVTLFGHMIGGATDEIREQDPVNRKAAEEMAKLHDELKKIGYSGRDLEVYLVRLLFCLFAEDSDIFNPDQFSKFVREKTNPDGSDLATRMAELLQVLNTPPEKRMATRDEAVAAFPYVNGNLFGEMLPIPAFSAEMRTALLDCGALDWSKISPAIFGAMFQGVMDETERHDLGAHYTSEKNILKVIRPLFLDRLREEFDKACLLSGPSKRAKLRQFHERIASLQFLDPACGCGNFLLIAYRELRRLETDVLEELHRDDPGMVLDVSTIRKVSVSQFHGIEIEQFPSEIAKVALWLMDHLCNLDLSGRFGQYFSSIPIKASPHVVCANALTMDWPKTDYVFGNPPFLGRTGKSPEQQAEVSSFFSFKDLDFVACWYAKANDAIRGTDTRCAFVSTNSITQGEQVAPLWMRMNAEIDFAYRTFKWHNEARNNAAVNCVIVGFHARDAKNAKGTVKTIYEADGNIVKAKNINGYLMDAPDVFVGNRSTPICDVPKMIIGNMPLDGGNLIVKADEYEDFIAREPAAKAYIRPLLGSKEFINRLPRYCLWLKNASPAALQKMPLVIERIRKCREFRLASKDDGTRRKAAFPATFRETNNPTTAVVVPKVSSERREYVPIGFIDSQTIVTDLNFMIPDATLYHFGILTSQMHNAWMRAVCGRLEMRYRYSKDVVYNNFVWPKCKDKKPIEDAAREILAVRDKYLGSDPDCTLAILYNPDTMPPDLQKAHQHLDALVDKAYGKKFSRDEDRVAHLFALYAAATAVR